MKEAKESMVGLAMRVMRVVPFEKPDDITDLIKKGAASQPMKSVVSNPQPVITL